MAETLSRKQCPDCGSQNNLTQWKYQDKVYEKCQTPGCRQTKCLTENIINTNIISHYDRESSVQFLTGEFKETRGLTIETCKALGIMMQGDRHIFQYKDAQKIRIPKGNKKGMYWKGNSKEAGLFGEHLYESYDKTRPIVITEGEFDCASIYQCGGQAFSIRGGAGQKKTAEEIKASLGILRNFSSIILWFDGDEAGQAALKEVLEIEDLPIEKVKIVSSDFKDANEVLQKDPYNLSYFIDNAPEYKPIGLQTGNELDFNILEEPEELGLEFPFFKMQDCYHGLRAGEILLIGAGSGAGKSLFSKHLAFHWMQNIPDIRIANIFLEEKQKFTLQSYMSLFLKKPAHQLIEMPYKGLADEGRKVLGSDRYYFDNHFGSLQSKQLFKKLRYLALKTDVIILDHISIVVSGMESREGERKDIDRMMTQIKSIAVETGCRFVLISHLRRANGDATYEQGMPITSNSFRGSHSLYQLSDSVIGLERDQQDDMRKNMLTIRALKNRFRGKVGILDELYYNEETGQLKTLEDIFN